MNWQIHRRLEPIRILSFDLDDTLYANAPVMAHAEQYLVDYLADKAPALADITVAQWRELRQQVAAENAELASDMSALRRATFVQELKRRGVAQVETLADEAMAAFFVVRNQVDIEQDIHTLLGKLAEKYTLIAISNGNADIHRIGIGDYFTAAVRPGPGVRGKPFTDMFELAAEKIQLEHPRHMLHIGDHPVSDVQGALRFGAQALWYNSPFKPAEGVPAVTWLPHASIQNIQALRALL
ncbi:hypothetical protein CWE15_10950 [Aliidiomarina taiwanensis]|uniref:Uncharacterized protein n=1 Tax=Aliidiomarina taiwanensis TaxID=946228 RepID=A0A432WVS9_9GAMM|nr:HAD-IA family hydrolase [Aliidiomarina taiwanensis]RUO37872.1 hypothetical protein CWE15_10950 [Aliidiomarina taiwanensis]